LNLHNLERDVRLVALGGLGEIGMNCLAIEQDGEVLLIDCGVTFPSNDLGIDVIYPKLDHLLDKRRRVRGVVLSHGHEDHIGALPYLLDALDVPVYGPPYAIQLARARLAEHGFDADALELHARPAGTAYAVGAFGVEPIRVTHSIADATALAIRTRSGLIVHTGDFKLDPSPPDGELTDEARLAELGREGVRLLLSDSTNVDSPGQAASERVVGETLERLIAGASTRVIVGLFASNIQRLLLLGAIAARTGRKICLLGRSVNNHVRIAQQLGRLAWPTDLVVSPDVAAAMPRERVLILGGGTQAEANAALTRLSMGTHSALRLAAGDVVILSSRIIPGNDRPVFDMMNNFLRSQVVVHTRVTEPAVHASGHAHRDEQLRMIELTQPRAFMPVHGTLHHLLRHEALARDAGVDETIVAENGEVVAFSAEARSLRKEGKVVVGRVATSRGEDLDDDVLRERSQLARMGVAFVSLVFDRTGALAAAPEVRARGVAADHGPVLRAVARGIGRALAGAPPSVLASDERASELARTAARRTFDDELGQRPQLSVAVTRL
jgi:ribonuclease J